MAVVGALMVSASTLAQNQNTTTTTTTVTTQGTVMTSESDHLSVGDRIFLMDLVHANAREAELSRVAFHQSNSPAVSDFAHHMLMEHRELQDQLMVTYGERTFLKDWRGAVSDSNMPIADSWGEGGAGMNKRNYNNWAYLYSEDWAQVHQLKTQNGTSLERMYVGWMAADHAKLLMEINRRDQETENPEIKALIATIRPIVERHLHRARDWSFSYSGNMDFNYLD